MKTTYGTLFAPEEMKEIRSRFYYVDADVKGRKRIFCDNAGGSLRLIEAENQFQAIDAIPDASEHTNELALDLLTKEDQGRRDMRLLFNAQKGAVATGYTASQLMMYIARIISDHASGTNVVTSVLEHPSSFDAMKMYAQKHNRELRVAQANAQTGGIDTEEVLSLVDQNTAILSVMAASNISGHVMDIQAIAQQARKINPNIFIICDAVQHAPHGALDPEAWGVDAMNIAPYKFFGVRGFGLLYVSDRIKDLEHHKLLGKPSDEWEIGSPGTAHFIAMSAIVDYVCQLGKPVSSAESSRREVFEAGMSRIAEHERALLEIMLEGTQTAAGLRHLSGVIVQMDDPDLSKRDLIIGVEFKNMPADKARAEMEKRGIIAYERMATSMYSKRMLEPFGSEGVVRISPLHVNTPEEMEQLLHVVKEVSEL